MQNNSQNFKKQANTFFQPQQVSPFAINDLQNTIDPQNFLINKDTCRCNLCHYQPIVHEQPQDEKIVGSKNKASTHWLKRLMDGLCLSGAKTLKLNFPDLLFVQGESFQTYQTSRKDGRIIKLSGTTALKYLYPTMIRYLKEYKYTLQINFNQKMRQTIEPQEIHITYFQQFVPSHFHDGMNNSQILQENKSQFKKYILHKSKKFQIQQIQQHKMNRQEPFCIVKYIDGNCQLFNQTQFQVYMLSSPTKLQEEIVFVQSYIKYKLQTESIYYSQCTLTPQSINSAIDRRAQTEVMILLGGINKFDQGFIDIDTIEEMAQELMQKNPKQYIKLMTYKMVHYLNMTSRIYIDHIKIKWIMNDLGNIYLQEIMEFEMSEIPRRHIKYRLPPKDEVLDCISNTNNFAQFYSETKRRKHINTMRIKKLIADKPIYNILEMMEPESQSDEVTKKRNEIEKYFLNKRKNQSLSTTSNYRTLNTAQNNRKTQGKRSSFVNQSQQIFKQRQIKSKERQRYTPDLNRRENVSVFEKNKKVQAKIEHYFTINASQEQTLYRSIMNSSKTQRGTSNTLHRSTEQRNYSKMFKSTANTLKDLPIASN